MISEKLRERLAYAAMSAFVAWHTLAMVIAPAPDSDVTKLVRVALQPYLTFFRLDNQWDFFAPTVGEGSRLRYDIQDRTGKTHAFLPADELHWYHPNFLWFRSWYYRIIDDPDNYADNAAAVLCRKHAALQPLAITFYEIQEEQIHARGLSSGKKRMDPGFFYRAHAQGHSVPRPMMLSRLIQKVLAQTGRSLVADLVSAQPDGAAGACPHRHRRGAAEPLRAGDALSVRFLGRRRLDAARDCSTWNR